MTIWSVHPVDDDVTRTLALLARISDGDEDARASLKELKHVDLKEEAGRWTAQGVAPSEPHNETAAKHLAAEAACMANTDGGGALIVGVRDDGEAVGTQLDSEWLRKRIYDLTGGNLTVVVDETRIANVRVLVLRCPEAVEPIRVNGKINWRVEDNCVLVDTATWHDRRMRRLGYDWSALPTSIPATKARASALERARDFLRASGEEHAAELADSSDLDLLSRLNVTTAEGNLTNAGVITFVGRDTSGLDYIRRDEAGGDSTNRVRAAGRALIEELYEVEQAIRASNPMRHVADGLVSGQVRQLPDGAVRECIVNGSVHRDWTQPEPTLIEHEGANLVVTSPGGFVGGVTPHNIITHPSEPRNRELAELFAALRVAEREGVGVDRIVREMLRGGHRSPQIEEVAGPRVRAVLVGELVDKGWVRWLNQLQPAQRRNQLNTILLLRALVDRWWIDARLAAPLLQRSRLETEDALEQLTEITIDGTPVVEAVLGVPDADQQSWQLTAHARAALDAADVATEFRRRVRTRRAVAVDYARARGRVSSTELASIVGSHPTNVQTVLKAAEGEGELAPGRESRRGPGFFYVPVSQEPVRRV